MSAIALVFRGLLLSAPFLLFVAIAERTNNTTLGIWVWVVFGVLGFPWYIWLWFVVGGIEQLLGVKFVYLFSRNSDQLSGMIMLVGCLSILINGFLVAWLLQKKKLQASRRSINYTGP